jgi:hypothetical protein
VDVVTAPEAALAHRTQVSRAAAFLRRNGILVGVVGVFGTVIAGRLAKEVTQDTWLALVAGRTVAHGGVPGHDHLTLWTLGQHWIDQQWLAHLVMYGLYATGGLVLLVVFHFVIVSATFAAGVIYARRVGGATRPVAWLVVATVYPIVFGAGNVRTQVLALPLFAAVLMLLVEDTRYPSRRVLLVLPLVALWANVHGSAVIGVALIVLRAAFGLRGAETRLRSFSLAAGAILALFATPYGFSILPYYQHTLLNPAFREVVTEWQPLTPGLITLPAYLLIGAALWLMARRTRELGRFELVAELMLILLSLLALRSVVWLGLGSLILLARPLAAALGELELGMDRLNVVVGAGGVALALIAMLGVIGRGPASLTHAYPSGAGAAVMKAAKAHPGSAIFADDRFADWLLLEHPSLAGRVLYDARFELLTSKQLLQIYEWKNQFTDHWRAPEQASGIILLDLRTERRTQSVLRKDPGLRQVYVDKRTAVFVRN